MQFFGFNSYNNSNSHPHLWFPPHIPNITKQNILTISTHFTQQHYHIHTHTPQHTHQPHTTPTQYPHPLFITSSRTPPPPIHTPPTPHPHNPLPSTPQSASVPEHDTPAVLMRMWRAAIKAFGSANVTSTGFGVCSHVILKDSFRFTNRPSAEAIDEQVHKLLQWCMKSVWCPGLWQQKFTYSHCMAFSEAARSSMLILPSCVLAALADCLSLLWLLQTLVHVSRKRTADTMAADAEAAEPQTRGQPTRHVQVDVTSCFQQVTVC